MKKVFIILCIGFLFIACSKKSQAEKNTVTQSGESVEINSSNSNVIISDSTDSIIIKGDNNTVSTESSKENN